MARHRFKQGELAVTGRTVFGWSGRRWDELKEMTEFAAGEVMVVVDDDSKSVMPECLSRRGFVRVERGGLRKA